MDSQALPMVLAQVGPNPVAQLVPLALILGVFYVLVIRPQQQKAKEHEDFLRGLKRGEMVVTTGGLYGRVVDFKDDEVTLEVAPNVRVRHERSKIAAPARSGAPAKADKSE